MAVIASYAITYVVLVCLFRNQILMFDCKITKRFLNGNAISQVLDMFYSTKLWLFAAKFCQRSIFLPLGVNFFILDRSISALFLTSSIFGLLSKLNENKLLSEGLCQ